jgi:diacylglycerol kinase (ATP)
VPVIARDCERANDLSDLIRATMREIESVIIGGGDGTLNAALPGLLETGLPLGIIPLGTANDLARTLGIPTDLAAAARIIARGTLQPVDIGEVNSHPFFNVTSIGFGVDLTRALTRDSKRRFGTVGYAIAALRAVSRLRPFRAEIMHGHTIHISRTIHVAVGNGRHYGGGMTVSEHARIDDGLLHIYSLEVDSLWRLLRLLPALRSGRHDAWKEIRTLEGEKIEVRTPRRPRSVNTDGEIVTQTPAHFRVQCHAISVFIP